MSLQNNEHTNDRRSESERIGRLEIVVSRLEVDITNLLKTVDNLQVNVVGSGVTVTRLQSDITGLINTYKEAADAHQKMFVEAIKSSTQLQGSIEMLNKTLMPLVTKVDEHDRFIWKGIGMVSSLSIFGAIVGELLIRHFT